MSEFPGQFAGQKAAHSDRIESDREIIVTFKLKTHGSLDHANGLIKYLKRQLSVMTHRDVEIVDYDVTVGNRTVE